MIKEAAIQRKVDGKVWTGRRHANIIGKIELEENLDFIINSEYIQGFVTDTGQFVDREEAYKIAVICNQLLHPTAHQILFSEDLY